MVTSFFLTLNVSATISISSWFAFPSVGGDLTKALIVIAPGQLSTTSKVDFLA